VEKTDELIAFLGKQQLFVGFSPAQLDEIIILLEEVKVASGTYIIRENEPSDNIYIIKEGELKVTKWDPAHQREHHLTTLRTGAMVGEIGVLDNTPRSASVRAIGAATLLTLSVAKLQLLSESGLQLEDNKKLADYLWIFSKKKKQTPQPSTYHLFIRNLAKDLGYRLRYANDVMVDILRKELEHEKARVALGILIIVITANLSLYIVAQAFLANMTHLALNSTAVSAPLVAFFASTIFVATSKSGYPLSFYGLTFKDWKPAVWNGILMAIPIMLVTVLWKYWLIHHVSIYKDNPFFTLEILQPNNWYWAVVYAIFVPLQEFIVRGALQSSFQGLFVGKWRFYWAIILSNLLFGVIHFHLSVFVGISVFVPGLFWGLLYKRYPTLIGVSISHIIAGVWALTVVGIAPQTIMI